MKLHILSLAVLAGTAALAPLAHAAGTAAGTNISNTATATFTDPGGIPRTRDSNTYIVQVDEILDVTVQSNNSGNVSVFTPATGQVLSFTVKNTGNGSEKYILSVQDALSGDDFDPSLAKVWLDDGDGVLETGPGGDTELVAGSNDPVLAAEASVRVFVVSDIPTGLADGDIGNIRLAAEAETAQGNPGLEAPGYTFAGAGTGGSDAVVGSTQASATVSNGYVVSQTTATFVKSSTILDPFGGTSAVPGAVITYSLELEFTGSGTATGALIVDAIPAGTTYNAGTLTLDAGALTDDASDADEGSYDGSQIVVDLGDVTAPATHTVTFKVTITP